MFRLIDGLNRLMLVSCGPDLIVGQLWHESYCWYSVARILLLVFCGTNLIAQPASQQASSQLASPPAEGGRFPPGGTPRPPLDLRRAPPPSLEFQCLRTHEESASSRETKSNIEIGRCGWGHPVDAKNGSYFLEHIS